MLEFVDDFIVGFSNFWTYVRLVLKAFVYIYKFIKYINELN